MIIFRKLYDRVEQGASSYAVVTYQSLQWLMKSEMIPFDLEKYNAGEVIPTSVPLEEKMRHWIRIDLWIVILEFDWMGPWRPVKAVKNGLIGPLAGFEIYKPGETLFEPESIRRAFDNFIKYTIK